jgi:lipopolysaccharide/colanic/teichoic acid biosynthesis glycosyltransferase
MLTHDPASVHLPAVLDFRTTTADYAIRVVKAIEIVDVLVLHLPGYALAGTLHSAELNSKAVRSFSEAKGFLLELIHQGAKLPSIIIYEGRVRFAEIRQFYAFLHSVSELKTIPFVYNHADERYFEKHELYEMVKQNLFDDVIEQRESKEHLLEGAEILASMKRMKLEAQASDAIREVSRQEKSVAVNHQISYFFKRALDIVVSAAVLLLVSPIMLLVALLIKLESRGPVFYISKRAGRCFQVFDFYKFRTMEVDADQRLNEFLDRNQYSDKSAEGGPSFFKLENDPRVTRVGGFLRKTSLDELPQLLNVLKGDMSLVGNRPLPLYEAATLTCNESAERFMAPAGITGLWQVKKRGKADMSVKERVGLDIEYSRNHNFFYDLRIMLKTPTAMFQESKV